MITLEDIKKLLNTTLDEKLDEKLKGLEGRLGAKLEQMKERMVKVEEEVIQLKKENEALKKQIRSRNLVIKGVEDADNEQPAALDAKIDELFSQLGVGKPTIDDIYRMGRKGADPRPILLKLVSTRDKHKILHSKFKIPQDKGIFINEDLSKEERRIQAILRRKKKELKRQDPLTNFDIRGIKLIAKKDNKIQAVFVVDENGEVNPQNAHPRYYN